MPSQLRIKTQFVSSVLKQTAERIQSEQIAVVNDWDLFKSGLMKSSLQGHFSVNSSENGAKLSMRYLEYVRLLDMKDPRRKLKREGYHLYNRIVFGTLYYRALPTLKYGFTEQIQQDLKKDIEDTLS